MADQNPYAAYGGSVATDTQDPTGQHSFRTGTGIGTAPPTTQAGSGIAPNDPYAAYGGSVAAQSEPSGTVINNRAEGLAAKGLSAAGLPTSIADIPNWFQHFIGVAKDSRPAWEAFKNAVENPTQENIVNAVPIIGPASVAMSKDVQKGDYLGAGATLAGTLAVPKVVETGGAVAKAVGGTAAKVGGKVGEVASKAVEKVNPESFKMPDEPAKPVSPHVKSEIPLDDATIRKSFDKNVSSDARDTLRQHVGDSVPAGSSVENHLMKAIRPVNETIQQQGLALNKLLQDAGPLKSAPAQQIAHAIENLKNDLPGGTEDTFGKAIEKEVARAKDVVQSTDPMEVNNYIRELDKRIDSYSAPEEPIDSPSQAADAARVTIRRILRDKINTEVPGTKPINDVLGKNLEVRNTLRKKFGDIAYDPVAAEAQHLSEFKKGQNYLDYEIRKAGVERNIKIALSALKTAGVTGLGLGALKHYLGE